jgi:hypothetical protein
MRIISFDVGMKNLAYCLFQVPDTLVATATAPASAPAPPSELIHQIQIERWDVIDLRFPPTNPSDAQSLEPMPPAPKRTCINDGKLAKWMYIPGTPGVTPFVYCSKCSEKSKYKTPSREILPIKRKPEILMKKKLGELMDIKAILSTSASTPASTPAPAPENLKLRKSDLIQEITMTLSRDYLEPFEESKYSSYIAGTPPPEKPKKVNYTYAHDLDLITYGRNMMKHLDAILYASSPSPSQTIDMMIIENQISTLASRMKTLQGMITQYFIMKHIERIEFISASCKLKLFTEVSLDVTAATATATDADATMTCVDASTYADRKKSGIMVCRSLGEISRKRNSDYAKWMPVFENHKKKDDLADCFLQGLWRFHLLKMATSSVAD